MINSGGKDLSFSFTSFYVLWLNKNKLIQGINYGYRENCHYRR
jgi:hypothetical protein